MPLPAILGVLPVLTSLYDSRVNGERAVALFVFRRGAIFSVEARGMRVFVLHAGQPELSPFLSLLKVPSGTVLPSSGADGIAWTVLSWCDTEATKLEAEAHLLPQENVVRRVKNDKVWKADLRLHGIRTAGTAWRQSGGTLARTYIIPVLQLESLGVYAAGGANGPIGLVRTVKAVPVRGGLEPGTAADRRPTAIRRAERTAVRAAYALGLDYAVVTVRTGGDGLPLVEMIDASPSVAAGPFASLYAAAVNRMDEQADSGEAANGSESKLQLGMDPEFVLRRPGPGGKIVLASRYLPRRGRVGCDSVRIGDKLIYPLAELRPSPAAEPQELFRNLYAAMRLAASRIDDVSLEWLAGGMPAQGLPLGGHIHVSGVALNADLVRAMDNYLALPLVLLEDGTTKRRRPRYGALGDFRRQFHGGFEYRTLPSWIVSPAVALGVISLAKVVCEHYRELRERPLARPEMQKHYYTGNKEAIRPTVLALWKQLERTSSYARYEKALNRLKRAIDRMEAWNEQQDVRVSWKIPPYRV